MNRITAGPFSTIKRNKILKLSKTFRGLSSKLYIFAKEQLKQSLYDSYIGRKQKKRKFSSIWNKAIGSYTKSKKISYSSFFGALRRQNILLNKKILVELLLYDKPGLNAIISII